MRKAALAAGAVVVTSLAARALAPSFSLYLEPYGVLRAAHLWQLVTWIGAGASLTFLVHAAIIGAAIFRGAPARQWLGVTFVAGLCTALLALPVPAVYSCTF